MPEYLTTYVPEAESGFWVTPTLRVARQKVDEAIAMSDDLSKPDTLIGGRLLLARIIAAEGDRASAASALEMMLGEFSADSDQADLHYWLWKVNPNAHTHGADALRLYQALNARTPSYRRSLCIEELRAAIEPGTRVGTNGTQD